MSPTYERTRRVQRDLQRLTRTQRDDFKAARRLFVEGLREGHFHPSLRVKRVQSARGVWEMSWAPDGRATFEYGAELRVRPMTTQEEIDWERASGAPRQVFHSDEEFDAYLDSLPAADDPA